MTYHYKEFNETQITQNLATIELNQAYIDGYKTAYFEAIAVQDFKQSDVCMNWLNLLADENKRLKEENEQLKRCTAGAPSITALDTAGRELLNDVREGAQDTDDINAMLEP